jgi:putative ABC transport system permease protein
MQRSLRDAIARVDKDQVVESIKTIDELKAESWAVDRLRSGLLGAFAAIAIALTAIGIFGVISYSVVQRTQEIGIRAALGATPAHLVALVVGGGMAWVAFGLAAGAVAAFGTARLLSSVLFGISPSDPTTLIAALSMLAAVAIPSNHRDTRAVPPFIARSTSASVAMLVSPGVVIASAPCAAPHSTAHPGPRSVISP